MLKIRLLGLALAGLSIVCAPRCVAATFQEDFSAAPSTRGWKIFGNTNLFEWDSTNQNLRVTWDSSQTNSYCYLPLGTILTRNDDFSFAFDLRLLDASTGDTTGPLQMALGLLNLADATGTNFARGAGVSPNVAEFDYFPAGYFPGYSSPATTQPAFIDRTSSAFAPIDLTPYDLALPTGQVMRITFTYTASNQTAALTVTTNGVALAQLPTLALTNPIQSEFAATNDYRVTVFSISSFSEAGQYPPYVGSILAHGVVDNVALTVPPPPIQNLTGAVSNGVWQVQFANRTNWLYTLERTLDFVSWSGASTTTSGNGTSLVLQDTNSPPARAFYRVRAQIAE